MLLKQDGRMVKNTILQKDLPQDGVLILLADLDLRVVSAERLSNSNVHFQPLGNTSQ